jgi:hypothetical protein
VARDGRTEAIFTTADDQMQGLWGFHRYVKAALDITKPEDLLHQLPPKMFPLTHEWVRYYDPKEMADNVFQMGEFLLSRQSLLGLVSVCEAALLRLNEHLANIKGYPKISANKKLLVWAFGRMRKSPVASPEATVRLPKTCGDLDNARRLRNCIVHRNGCYDEEMYLQDVIRDDWVIPQFERNSQSAAANRETIFLTTGHFERLTRSHIEFLHILHNTIQCQEFGHSVPYNYADENKSIEWYRILSGRRDVKM